MYVMGTATLRRLAGAEGGISAVEFALSLPILLSIGGFGVEIANLALTHLRVSQYALYLADNASRVGLTSPLASTQLRETDINDIFQGLRLQSAPIKLTTYGRVTLSSLENIKQSYDSAPVQRIHWQRCIGLRSGTGYASKYGTTAATDGSDGTAANKGTTVTSMGDSWSPVTAPAGVGVMFVEINYDYRPLFGSMFVSAQKLHYIASYIVRDSRDFSQIYNPSPSQTASNCSAYTT